MSRENPASKFQKYVFFINKITNKWRNENLTKYPANV